MISDPKGLMNLRFKCPKCGSSRFGTSYAGDWDRAVGHCHGFGCDYEWKRQDDEGHFIRKTRI